MPVIKTVVTDEPEITEIKKLKVTRVDAVENPANGFPILLMKAVNPQGGIDEKPDIATAEHVLVLLFQLIQAEAAEGAAGAFRESCDIALLSEAISLVQYFLSNEQYGDEDDGVAKEVADVAKAHRKFSADERKRLASEGKALPDGSYPIPDADALHRAAILARSGHGDVAAAKRLIAKRAKELGVANPLADSAAKEAEPVETGIEKTSAPEGAGTGEATPDGEDLAKQIEDAKTEVKKASEERDAAIAVKEALEAELAKVKATPIPGGPAISAPQSVRTERERSDHLAKALHFDRLADQVTEQDLKSEYRRRAAEARTAAKA